MKPRTFYVMVAISNDGGAVHQYTLRPLAAADLAQSVAAFRLTKLTSIDAEIYTVRLSLDGQVTCDCPQHQRAGACKHADALAAAGVLPCALVAVLQQRTRLVDAAEAESQRLAEAAIEERKVHEHDAHLAGERIADLVAACVNLNETVAVVKAEAARLKLEMEKAAVKPARRRARRAAA